VAPNSSIEATIDELARRQHGVVHRRQLLAASATYRQIERRLANGRLIALGHGVYALPSAPATRFRQFKAAQLAIDGAIVCGLAAADLHDLRATASAAPEIAVHPSASHRCSFARVHRRIDVEATVVAGIAVTTVAQTLVDIADRLTIGRLEDVWSTALIRRRTTLDQIAARVGAAGSHRLRHRGAARALLTSLDEGSALAESELEELLFQLARRVPGVPHVVRQMALPWWKGGRGRADVGIPDWRVILEADGRSWHARLRDFDADRLRDNVAAANGYAVLRFGAGVLEQGPDEVVDLIARTGRHRRTA